MRGACCGSCSCSDDARLARRRGCRSGPGRTGRARPALLGLQLHVHLSGILRPGDAAVVTARVRRAWVVVLLAGSLAALIPQAWRAGAERSALSTSYSTA